MINFVFIYKLFFKLTNFSQNITFVIVNFFRLFIIYIVVILFIPYYVFVLINYIYLIIRRFLSVWFSYFLLRGNNSINVILFWNDNILFQILRLNKLIIEIISFNEFIDLFIEFEINIIQFIFLFILLLITFLLFALLLFIFLLSDIGFCFFCCFIGTRATSTKLYLWPYLWIFN